MKHLLSIFIIVLVVSCNAQEKEIDITGNWYLEATNSGTALYYTEFYINEKYFYKYNEFLGMSNGYKYTYENNILNLIDLDNTKLMGMHISSIDKNTLFLVFDDDKTITYKRIIDNKVKLKKLATEYHPNFTKEEKIAFENIYLEAFFLRKAEWEKTHVSMDYFED